MRAIQKITHKLAWSTNTRVDVSVNARHVFYPIDKKMLQPLDQPQGLRSDILNGSDGSFGGKL